MTDQQLFRLRVRYVKTGRLRYLGHLEVLRTVERIVRRAELPYTVTQGFSPHMRIGFSSALPVGTSSTCEWFDIFLTGYVPADEALRRLAAASPVDLAAQEAGYVDIRADALTAFITRASYLVRMTPRQGVAPAPALEAWRSAIDQIRAAGGFEYRRGRKTKRLDVARTLISYTLEEGPSDGMLLKLDTALDNEGAMRPDLLVAAADRALDPAGAARELAIGPVDLAFVERIDIERTGQWGVAPDGSPLTPLMPPSRASGRRRVSDLSGEIS